MYLMIAKQNDEFSEAFFTSSIGVGTSKRSLWCTWLGDGFSDNYKSANHLVDRQLDGVHTYDPMFMGANTVNISSMIKVGRDLKLTHDNEMVMQNYAYIDGNESMLIPYSVIV